MEHNNSKGNKWINICFTGHFKIGRHYFCPFISPLVTFMRMVCCKGTTNFHKVYVLFGIYFYMFLRVIFTVNGRGHKDNFAQCFAIPQNSINWVKSDKPLDTRLSESTRDSPRLSAGKMSCKYF